MFNPTEITSFWAKVQVSEPDECWIWTGAIGKQGYGNWNTGGKTWRVARASWTIAHGPIPEGNCVCHTCDNPPCVNPGHLFLGTPADNMADMTEKGRRARKGPSGERNSHAKLTASQVLEIRNAHANGARQVDLQRQYGMSRTTIFGIVHRILWNHI